jgi:hypothetical protein
MLLWYERDGGLLQAFEPADKTGPDAMEYRRLLFMMECSSAEEISCVQSVCFDPRFSNAAGNLTSSKACFHIYPVYGTDQDRTSGILGTACTLATSCDSESVDLASHMPCL